VLNNQLTKKMTEEIKKLAEHRNQFAKQACQEYEPMVSSIIGSKKIVFPTQHPMKSGLIE
jgi:hypothetical protein